MSSKSFASFSDLSRTQHLADIKAAEALRRSASLRRANPRKPGTGPAIAKAK